MLLTLPLTGCSAAYTGERFFWRAEQLSAPIVKNRGNATPEQFAKAIKAFELVREKAPGTSWAPRADVSIGSLYAAQKQYAKAREAYALVLQNYNQYQELCLGSRVAMAKTYEAEQQWDDAIKVYQDISDYHPWTVAGLEAPLYVGRLHEQRKNNAVEATKAYERAARMYNKLILDAPTPALATQVKSYLILAYQRLDQWNDAVTLLEELVDTQTGAIRPLALLKVGVIYQTKLNNREKAEAAYARLVQEFPDHPFGKAAKAQLERMGLSVAPVPIPAPAPTPAPK